MVGMDQVGLVVPPSTPIVRQGFVGQLGPDRTGVGHDVAHPGNWIFQIRFPCAARKINRANVRGLQITQNRVFFVRRNPDHRLLAPPGPTRQADYGIKSYATSGS